MTPQPERLDPDVSLLRRESTDYVAVPIVITNAEEYAQSAERLKVGKLFVDKVTASFGKILDKIKESLKETQGLRDSIVNPVVNHRRAIEQARYAFERQQAAEQAKAQAEALQLAEQARQADQESLAAMGFEDMVVTDHHLPAPMPVGVPRSPGISKRKGWSAEVYDEAELFLAVMAGKAPRAALVTDQVFLNGLARLHKTTLNIPGVRAVYKEITNVKV